MLQSHIRINAPISLKTKQNGMVQRFLRSPDLIKFHGIYTLPSKDLTPAWLIILPIYLSWCVCVCVAFACVYTSIGQNLACEALSTELPEKASFTEHAFSLAVADWLYRAPMICLFPMPLRSQPVSYYWALKWVVRSKLWFSVFYQLSSLTVSFFQHLLGHLLSRIYL